MTLTIITIICAWCQKTLGEKDGQGIEGESHGICDDCLNRYFPYIADVVAKLSITEQYRYPDYKVRDG